jgi:cytochrome c oxidase cbb3-type subunit 3
VKSGKKSARFLLSGALLGSLYLMQGQTAAGQQAPAPPDAQAPAAQSPTAPQTPPAARGGRGGAAGGPARPVAYPARPRAPEDVIARGKATFGVSCAFCHGSDAGGGEVGPNLQRSAVVLEDQKGELIAPIVHGGRVDQGMPRIDITDAQITDVAAWLHSLVIASRTSPDANINIVTGDAAAGEIYFKKTCASCHSATGDLAGIASRITNPKTLQETWLLPGGGGGRGPGPAAPVLGLHVPPVTVTVTLANGQKTEGNLYRIDDFYVGLTTADGTLRSFRRDGEIPKVELHDPLAPHRALVQKYTDKDIHNLTAYMVTLK